MLTILILAVTFALGGCLHLISKLVETREELTEAREELFAVTQEMNLYKVYTVDPQSEVIKSLSGPITFYWLLRRTLEAIPGDYADLID